MNFDTGQLDELLRDIKGSTERSRPCSQSDKGMGSYQTPLPLVRFMATVAIETFKDGVCDIHDSVDIVDLATGDGRFIHAMASLLSELGQKTAHRFVSFDVSERGPDRAGKHSKLDWQHFKEDALKSIVANESSADIVIGNPPYVNGKYMSPSLRASYQGRFLSSSSGDWNLYGLFLEKGYKLLKPGGVLAMVIPSSWMRGEAIHDLRLVLQKDEAIRGVIDFGDVQLFKNATTYSSIVFLQKNKSKDIRDVAVAKFENGAWSTNKNNSFKMPPASSSQMSSNKGFAAFNSMVSDATVGDLFSVYKGSGTGANSVFIKDMVAPEMATENCWQALWLGRDIGRLTVPDHFILLPYDSNGELLPPKVLEERFPLSWQYLLQNRETLGSREKGKFHGRFFYALGRPNSLKKVLSGSARLLVPDVTKIIRTTLDKESLFFADSVVAIEPKHHVTGKGKLESIRLLTALQRLLESEWATAWLKVHGAPLKGGYTRMTPKTVSAMAFPKALCTGDSNGSECLQNALVQ